MKKKKYKVFFPQILVKCYVFFFSQEKFKIHSLTQIQNGEKKNSPVKKKKTGFSLTQSIFSKMLSKLNYSGEKKIRYLCMGYPKKKIGK